MPGGRREVLICCSSMIRGVYDRGGGEGRGSLIAGASLPSHRWGLV